jgi:hypothetical protein
MSRTSTVSVILLQFDFTHCNAILPMHLQSILYNAFSMLSSPAFILYLLFSYFKEYLIYVLSCATDCLIPKSYLRSCLICHVRLSYLESHLGSCIIYATTKTVLSFRSCSHLRHRLSHLPSYTSEAVSYIPPTTEPVSSAILLSQTVSSAILRHRLSHLHPTQ